MIKRDVESGDPKQLLRKVASKRTIPSPCGFQPQMDAENGIRTHAPVKEHAGWNLSEKSFICFFFFSVNASWQILRFATPSKPFGLQGSLSLQDKDPSKTLQGFAGPVALATGKGLFQACALDRSAISASPFSFLSKKRKS